MIDLSLFKHRTEIAVRYGDIDMLRHVNNAKYLTYLEQARVQYAIDVLQWDGNWDTLNMILARVEVDFCKPIFIHDHIAIYSRVSRLGNKSFDMEYVFIRNNDLADITGEAKAVLVAYDTVNQRSHPLPEVMRIRIIEHEKEGLVKH
jgi:acyl-CoA thioester hydrolase